MVIQVEVMVGVSKNHVHLTENTWKNLFGDKPMIKRNDLSQPGQFATIETVDLRCNGKLIEHVRVVGPFRNYNQIELSKTDANFLGLNPPRRQSGEIEGTPGIELISKDKKEIIDNGVILAEAHVHMSKKLCDVLGLENKQEVYVYKDKKFLIEAKIKATDDGKLELHIDTDESNLYNLETGSKVDVRVCGK